MKKPLIAVLPLYDREKDSYWMLPGYFAGLQAAGAVPVMLPLFAEQDTAQLARDFDGFLFTGGQDVDPVLYGEQMLDCCGELNSARDRMEAAMLQELMNLKKPVLGICRGLQLINACLGGTLWQDLPSQRPEGRNHRMERPYDRAEHSVALSGPLEVLYASKTLGVNSCHHQGIKTLAPGLEPMAIADDGLIEAVFHPDYPFLWAVQWHPEFFDPAKGPGTFLFRAFAEAAMKGK